MTGEPGVGKTVLLDRPQRRGTPGGARCANTRLFIVGSPKVTTSVIEAAPLAVIDLPLRGRLPNGRSTPSPAEVVRRYGLDADLAGALESIDTWTGAVVNR